MGIVYYILFVNGLMYSVVGRQSAVVTSFFEVMFAVYSNEMIKEMSSTLSKIHQITRFSALRYLSQRRPNFEPKKNIQIEYMRSLTQEDTHDWKKVKEFILKNHGNIHSTVNTKNINSVIIKTLISCNKLDIASSFVDYINANEKQLSFGSINGLLEFYFHLEKTRALTDTEKKFISESYDTLYKKFKSLDYVTCEKLIHALCAIDDWQKALMVLKDLKQSATPSHSAYSTIIVSLFKNNEKSKALELIKESINNRRVLQNKAYKEWIAYTFRQHKDEDTISKNMDEIMVQIKSSFTIVTPQTAKLLIDSFSKLGWNGSYTKIRKTNGQCLQCNEKLDCLVATNEEFEYLQKNIRERLIIGSDLFLKTNPGELKQFIEFVENNAPFDVVIDALNVSFAAQGYLVSDKLRVLNIVVNHFVDQKKKVLVLGRKHMLKWNKADLNRILSKSCSFFTEDLSQDDPYLITAAILSGPHTDIMSKDLFRQHLHNLKDEGLRNIFKRWLWQHQWMVYMGSKQVNIQGPLKFTPCTQFKKNSWHLPIEADKELSFGHVNDGIPNLSSWLCLNKR